LVREIREGVHPWDVALASVKELAATWGCHAQTVSKALDRVVAAGVLERRGRQHFPVMPRPRRKLESPTLHCVGASGPDGRFRMETDRESDFWRDLGMLAAQAGLSLVRSGWNHDRICPDRRAVGVVASTWHLSDPQGLCMELARLRLPVCVWIEEHTLEARSLKRTRIRFHDQGYTSRVGAQVAAHLLDLGHVRLAWISPWHGSQWSRNRLRGVEEEVGLRGARLEALCLPGESDWDRVGPAREEMAASEDFPADQLSRLVEGSSGNLRESAILELAWNRIHRDMEPLLERALASGATAWIGANDPCALYARAWLRARGIDVPGRISVAGFDDTAEALRSDLTSYRFASANMARAMLRQILSPGPSPSLSRHEGVVVRRGSTAPPPR